MMLNSTVLSDIKTIIHTARDKAIRAVDTERVLMYWHIGQRIFLEEQEGKDIVDYGKFLIKTLSEKLQPQFGSGFSYRQINLYRQFYRIFPIVHAVRAQLSWTHYKSFRLSANINGFGDSVWVRLGLLVNTYRGRKTDDIPKN